jgi:hypothetical protein
MEEGLAPDRESHNRRQRCPVVGFRQMAWSYTMWEEFGVSTAWMLLVMEGRSASCCSHLRDGVHLVRLSWFFTTSSD